MSVRDLIRSAVFWTFIWTAALFLFLIYGGRPVLRLLGMLFELLGGPGAEGTGL